MTEPLAMVTRGLSADMQTWLRWGEKTELRVSDISETSILVSSTVQELHFPCLHFEVKAGPRTARPAESRPSPTWRPN